MALPAPSCSTCKGGICIDVPNFAADNPQSSKQTGSLPAAQVSNVSAPVMEVVLEFIYTDLMPALPEAFVAEEGAEELFYAADRYLIFPMKVRASRLPHTAALFQPSLRPHGGSGPLISTCDMCACQWPRAGRVQAFRCARENWREGL